MKKQSGFAVVELVVVLVLVAAVVGVGYFVWHEQNKKNPVATTTTSSTGYQSPATSVPAAPQVTKASDLNSAMQALNQTDVTAGNTDSNQLSTQAAAF